MDEVNINKYLAQFNPILVVPVLSAVFGAILVFVFGFKRQTEPRFTTASAIDSIKKTKRKSVNGKNTENAAQSSLKQQQNAASAKVNNSKKASSNNSANTETSTPVMGKKMGATNEKAGNNNINKKKDEKKSEEKKSDSGSPVKKVANAKKIAKETTVNNKKLKTNKKSSSEEHDEKPSDFDGDGWVTVTKKQQKSKNENDGNGNKSDNPSPKQQPSKTNYNNNKSSDAKFDNKEAEQPVVAATKESQNEFPSVVQPAAKVEVDEVEQNETEPFVEAAQAEPHVVNEIVDIVEPFNEQPNEEKQPTKTIPYPIAVNSANANNNADSAIAFDELGEWTDAKPDRKRGNKKKSRKD